MRAIGIPALLAALAVTTWSCGGHVADMSITPGDTVRGTAPRLVERRGNVECPPLGQSCQPANNRWTVPEPAPSFELWAVALKQPGKARQQRIPLPAYDDKGIPIDRAEIEARMRGSGTGRAAGGLVGGLVGGGLGFLLGSTICPMEILGPGCSPRDEAYASVAFLSGLVWGIAAGAFIGGEISGTDRWEALEQIRAERRQILSSGSKE